MSDQPTPPPSPFDPLSEPDPVPAAPEPEKEPEAEASEPELEQDVQDPVATDTELELPAPEPAAEPIPDAEPADEPADEPIETAEPAELPEPVAPEKPLKRPALERARDLRRKIASSSDNVENLEANLVAAQDARRAAEEREETFRRSAQEWESHSKGLKHQYDELYSAYVTLEAELHAICDEYGID